ncbi:hypothetical protein GO986_20045 [Deinococcus sp. HMF7620]|uniref:Uncharacterized protein n=1 Tax=Deinococcus arboris TaxID=2682977 RepID=A0A7C9LR14_9DEIO|nr:hypothetical protein [Deinococcus arboris]MVN89036.1 hypothetical protein [Deinococcus arboris]
MSTKQTESVSAGKIRAVAAARGAHYVPVWLDCDPTERERRVTHPGRLARAKLRDPALLRAILEASGTLPPPPDALVLDTTRMSPDDAAREIVAFRAGLT